MSSYTSSSHNGSAENFQEPYEDGSDTEERGTINREDYELEQLGFIAESESCKGELDREEVDNREDFGEGEVNNDHRHDEYHYGTEHNIQQPHQEGTAKKGQNPESPSSDSSPPSGPSLVNSPNRISSLSVRYPRKHSTDSSNSVGSRFPSSRRHLSREATTSSPTGERAETSGVAAVTSNTGIALEQIRAGLGAAGTSFLSPKRTKIISTNLGTSPSAVRDAQFPFLTEEDMHQISQYYQDPNATKLVNLCLEVLEFTQLLENSRAETAKEWTEKSQVVRQFEKLYDSVRDRETLFRSKIAEHRKKFQIREGKYFHLRKRARQHLREWQIDRDRFHVETESINSKIRQLEGELTNLTRIISGQKVELLELRSKAKNMPSEKETTDYNLQLRSLQNENAQLLTEGATLKATLDEVTVSVQKRLPASSTGESWTNVLNTMTPDEFSRLRTGRLEDSKTAARMRFATEVAQLEKVVEDQRQKIRLQAQIYHNDLEELERLRDEFLEYKAVLEGMLRQPNQQSTDPK